LRIYCIAYRLIYGKVASYIDNPALLLAFLAVSTIVGSRIEYGRKGTHKTKMTKNRIF